METFDVVVLGAGPGGYTAAVRAAQLGRSVAVVEHGMWGGVCLNLGCVPAKTLLRHAEVADLVTRERDTFGLRGEMTADYAAAHARSRTVADGRVKGVHYLMRKNGIAQITGSGRFRDARTLDVDTPEGPRPLRFRDAIIATGARPQIPGGMATSERVVTYAELIVRESAPESLVIIGGGAIGVEFACLLSAFGTEVTIVEYLPRLLPGEDEEVSAELEKQLSRRGIRILTGARVTSVEEGADGVRVQIDAAGERASLRAELALVATGFTPRTEGIGLDRAGVRVSERGAVEIDEVMRTSTPGIRAIGDVTGKLQLAHVAETQGIVAAESIAGAETVPIADYARMPRAVFSRPQVASFGLTEQQARESGARVAISSFPFVANAKAHALGESEGFVKLIAEAEHGMLLGAHMVGPDVSELLPQLTLAAQYELSAEEIARNVHTHPTLSEAMLEAAHGVLGSPINI